MEGRVDNVKNGALARGELTKGISLLGERHLAKNMAPQSPNWHGASRADSREGADFMAEQNGGLATRD